MSLPSIKFSEMWPGKDFKGQGHSGMVNGQIMATLRGCRPTAANQCSYQVSISYNLLQFTASMIYPRQGHGNFSNVKG